MIRATGLVNCLIPGLLLIYYGLRGQTGENPVEFYLRATGTLAMIFLLLSLVVTPLRWLSRWHAVGKLRRMFGLSCFAYGLAHFIIYLFLEESLDLRTVAQDVLERPFVALGFLALFFLVPLAVTSTDRMVRRLGGARWQRLHRRVYVIAILAVAHDALLVKADRTRPLIYGAILALLLGARLLRPLLRRG